MLYPEFCKYKSFVDPLAPLCNAYESEKGGVFYVEPGFYTGLSGFKEHRAERFSEIMSRIDGIVAKNKKVIFTADIENPFVVKDDFIYLEISDITDPLRIFVEDKSVTGNYGD